MNVPLSWLLCLHVLLYRVQSAELFQVHWFFSLGRQILRSNPGSLQVRLDLDGYM